LQRSRTDAPGCTDRKADRHDEEDDARHAILDFDYVNPFTNNQYPATKLAELPDS
jgi:hypothetical protein